MLLIAKYGQHSAVAASVFHIKKCHLRQCDFNIHVNTYSSKRISLHLFSLGELINVFYPAACSYCMWGLYDIVGYETTHYNCCCCC